MFCKKCGAENPDGSQFCRECGAELIATDTESKKNSVDISKKSRLVTTLLILFGCLLLIICNFVPLAYFDDIFSGRKLNTDRSGWIILFGSILIIIFRLIKLYFPTHLLSLITLFFSGWLSCSVAFFAIGYSEFSIKPGYFAILFGTILLVIGMIRSMIEKHKINVAKKIERESKRKPAAKLSSDGVYYTRN